MLFSGASANELQQAQMMSCIVAVPDRLRFDEYAVPTFGKIRLI